MDNCEGAAVACLAEQALCLNHFVARCYDGLERIDTRGLNRPVQDAEEAQARNFVDECSNQALNVCLTSEKLSNLERGRLLDILLWAGELYAMVRPSLNDASRAVGGKGSAKQAPLAFAKR